MRLRDCRRASGFVITLAVLAQFVVACASAPSIREARYPNRGKPELFAQVVRSLSAGGYEVRNKDASAGVVQAFRPMTGAFSKPGYGHRVTVTVEDNRLRITVFPMEGVIGGESPDEIQGEVTRLLGGT